MVDWFKHFEDLVKHSKRIHSTTYWTGILGALVMLFDAIMAGTGHQLTASQNATILAIGGVLITMILTGHWTAGKILDLAGKLVSAFHGQPSTTVPVTQATSGYLQTQNGASK